MTWFANRAERREAEALTRYWDEIVRRAPAMPVPPPESPRVPAAVVRRLQTLETKDATRPVYEDALLERLLATYETESDMSTATVAAAMPPIAPGRRANDAPRTRSPLPAAIGRHATRAIAFIVVAAILLGLVAGIWLASRPNDGVNNIQPAATPMVETTPDDGSNFLMYRGSSGRTGVVNAPGPAGSPVELWTLTGLSGAFSWSAAVSDGVLYAAGGTEGLIALDAMTGARLWNFPTQAPVDSAPAVGHGLVFFGDVDGLLFAVDIATHEERWSMAGTRSNSAVALVGDLLYTVTPEGTSYALNAVTGEVVWQANSGAEAAGAPSVADGIALQNNADQTIHAFDALTGEPLWTFVGGVGGGMATPTIAHGVVYATTDGETNQMFALNATTGEEIWHIDREVGAAFISATATANRVYSISEDAVLHAIDASDGSEVWTYQLGGLVHTIPILAGSTLYTVDNAGFVRAINASNGAEVWNYPVEGGFWYGLAVAGDVVYTGTDIGNFYAITGSDSLAILVESDQGPSPSPAAKPEAPASPEPAQAISGTIVVEALFTGGPAAPLGSGGAMTVAPDGRIWVSDSVNHRFQIFEPDGTFVEVWGERGNGDGQFEFLRGNGDPLGAIAFSLDGSFWVADTANARIQHFDANRDFVYAFGERGNDPGQLLNPIDVGLDSQGNIWVNDDRRNRLIRFGPDLQFDFEVGDPELGTGHLANQWHMRVAQDDTVWVTGSVDGLLQRWSNEGALLGAWLPANLPGAPIHTSSIDFDANGNVYILDTDSRSLFVYTSEMELVGSWAIVHPDGVPLSGLADVILLEDGSLAISDLFVGVVLLLHLDPPITD